VWQYIESEKIEMPSLYFTHGARRSSTGRGVLLANTEFNTLLPGEKYEKRKVRFPHGRRCDLHWRSAFKPRARWEEIVAEVAAARITERGRTRGRQAERERDGRPQEGGPTSNQFSEFFR